MKAGILVLVRTGCVGQNGGMLKIIGLVCIVLGAAALIYGHFSYTKEETVFELGSMEAKFQSKEKVTVPPLVAGGVLAAGVGMLVAGVVRKK